MQREQKYVHVMILTVAYLLAIRLNNIQKKYILKQIHVPSIEKMSTFCVVMWMNTNLVCKMFFTCFFIP